jgi:hypothetical protein
MRICLPKFRITTRDPYVSIKEAWVAHKANSKPGLFTSLALSSFLSEAKQTFTSFPKTHHTLRSSRATSSHLGGFTSKSNKCHKDCFIKIKCSSAHKEDSLNPPHRISHKSYDPHKEELGRAHKGLGWVYFMGGTSNLKRREGESFYICPPKTSRWKLASKNRNIRFWKLKHPVFRN